MREGGRRILDSQMTQIRWFAVDLCQLASFYGGLDELVGPKAWDEVPQDLRNRRGRRNQISSGQVFTPWPTESRRHRMRYDLAG